MWFPKRANIGDDHPVQLKSTLLAEDVRIVKMFGLGGIQFCTCIQYDDNLILIGGAQSTTTGARSCKNVMTID